MTCSGMKKHCRWWLFAGLWGLSLVQHPLLASQNISSPEPAGEGNFEAYLSGLRERALNGDPAAARELAVHYDVEGNAAETSKWMSEYVSLAEKRANNGDVDSMLDLGKLFYTGSRLYPKNLERARQEDRRMKQRQPFIIKNLSRRGRKRRMTVIPRRRYGLPLFMNESWFRTVLRKSQSHIFFRQRKAAT